MGLASFPWYDLAEIRWAQDVLWSAIGRDLRERGWRDVPAALERSQAHTAQWVSPELLLSQACGYDVLYGFADALKLVATPRFAAPGCEGPSYSSYIVVRDRSRYEKLEDLRGARAAIKRAHLSLRGQRAAPASGSPAGGGALLRQRSHKREPRAEPSAHSGGRGRRSSHRLRHACPVRAAPPRSQRRHPSTREHTSCTRSAVRHCCRDDTPTCR